MPVGMLNLSKSGFRIARDEIVLYCSAVLRLLVKESIFGRNPPIQNSVIICRKPQHTLLRNHPSSFVISINFVSDGVSPLTLPLSRQNNHLAEGKKGPFSKIKAVDTRNPVSTAVNLSIFLRVIDTMHSYNILLVNTIS